MDNIINGVGLVLDGGGGKGAYQVGVLKALKENGLLDEVVAISGASIGAVNAMLYAMDDINIMYEAWQEIDLETVFDIDLESLFDKKPYFIRDEMINLVNKYIDFDKIKNGRYKIFNSICRLDETDNKMTPEYRLLSDYDEDMIKKILMASTALPLIYEAVEIDGNYYRDGGICDNEPVKPLYDMGIRRFIIIGMAHDKVFTTEKWPDASFITIYPSYNLGKLVLGTLNFNSRAIEFREKLGYKDGIRSIRTRFNPDETYIKLEAALAKNDFDEIMMQMGVDSVYDTMEKRINSNLDKFDKLAKKYENY